MSKCSQTQRSRCLMVALMWLVLPGIAWASGKICAPGMSCQWLFRGSIIMSVLGVVCLVALTLRTDSAIRRIGLLLGVINLVMGERFWSHPTYDIFFNNSTVMLLQMAVGVLCIALAALQIRRHRHPAPS